MRSMIPRRDVETSRILTYAVIVVRQYEAMVAAAVEGANRVSARAVPTGVSLTLIYV